MYFKCACLIVLTLVSHMAMASSQYPPPVEISSAQVRSLGLSSSATSGAAALQPMCSHIKVVALSQDWKLQLPFASKPGSTSIAEVKQPQVGS